MVLMFFCFCFFFFFTSPFYASILPLRDSQIQGSYIYRDDIPSFVFSRYILRDFFNAKFHVSAELLLQNYMISFHG